MNNKEVLEALKLRAKELENKYGDCLATNTARIEANLASALLALNSSAGIPDGSPVQRLLAFSEAILAASQATAARRDTLAAAAVKTPPAKKSALSTYAELSATSPREAAAFYSAHANEILKDRAAAFTH